MVDNSYIADMTLIHSDIYSKLLLEVDSVHLHTRKFSKQFRGNLLNDISVIFMKYSGGLKARIFLKNKKHYINHTMLIKDGQLITINMVNKIYNEDNK